MPRLSRWKTFLGDAMLIMKFKEFMCLPPGTLFSEYEPVIFKGINIKGVSYGNVFYYRSLLGNIDNTDIDYWEIAEKTTGGFSFKLDFKTEQRSDFFGDSSLFAVYEKEEVEEFILTLQQLDNA